MLEPLSPCTQTTRAIMAPIKRNVTDRNPAQSLVKADVSQPSTFNEMDGLPDEFITPPPSKKMQAEEESRFAAQLNEELKWDSFISRDVSETKDRRELKKYLVELLDGLERRSNNNPLHWPSASEIERLSDVVERLAGLLGVQKFDWSNFVGAMNRIENRWNKISLTNFVDQLVDRLCRVPISPASAVHHAIEKCCENKTKRRDTLREVLLVLQGKANPDGSKFPWEKLLPAIKDIPFPTTTLSPADSYALQNKLATDELRRSWCYLVLMDLRRQQLEWQKQYADRIAPSLHWIYTLQRQKDYDKLIKVYFGDVLSPQEMTEWLRRDSGRERRTKHYRTHSAKKRRKTKAAKQGKTSSWQSPAK